MANELTEVKVDNKGQPMRSNTNQFVYVNPAFVGSVNSVSAGNDNRRPAPVNGVYREQYWACSKWPYTQRVLAIAVGVLLGALIGLALSMLLRDNNDVIAGIYSGARSLTSGNPVE